MQRRATLRALAFAAAMALTAAAPRASATTYVGSADYPDAFKAFSKAERMPDGEARRKLWREAADLYRAGLEKAPAARAAPEAAINGAIAYRTIGMFAEALDMYELFIREYGKPALLAALKEKDPREWLERTGFVRRAREATCTARVVTFSYREAAECYAALVGPDHPGQVEVQHARDAAANAAHLYVAVGERARGLAMRARLVELDAPAADLAAFDLHPVSFSAAAWDEHAPDTGPNRVARLAALTAYEGWLRRWEKAAPPPAVHAAYTAAKLRRAGGDEAGAAAWCDKAVRAFERYRAATPSFDARTAELAAECGYAALDAEARALFGDAGRPRVYAGDAAAVARTARRDLERAAAFARKVEVFTQGAAGERRAVVPPLWASAATARTASLHDAVARGLAAARARGLSGEAISVALVEARRAAVRGYADAVSAARKARVSSEEVTHAARRLAALAVELGDASLFADGLAQPPGLWLGQPADVLAAPLPDDSGR